MKKNFLFFIFSLFIFCSEAQNLVPNGDFEIFSSCPNNYSQINLATPWYDPTGATSDYYNSCSNPSFIGIPSQGTYYYQPAKSGNAYAGFYAIQPFGTNFREYIQIALSDSLKFNNCYRVRFYVNLANFHKYATNNVGAYLSSNSITVNSPNPYNINAHISLLGNPVINDTLNWIMIQGNYQANGGENYLTIGNFKNDTNTVVQIADTSFFATSAAYYYIDDVSIINCNDTLSSVNEIANQYAVKLYPNPNNGSFTIECSSFENEPSVLSIYDVTGKLIRKQAIIKKNKRIEINANDLDGGIYFYQLVVNEKQVKSDRFIIIK
jgi:hypothetical protein